MTNSNPKLFVVHWSLIILLLLCLFAQAMTHARTASITFDEGPHLAIGYATLRAGDLRLQPVHIHPPLANLLAAAPLLLQDDLPDPRAISGWEIASLSAITDTVVWQYPHPRRLALASRFPIILMTLLLGTIIYRWANDLFGPRAGLLALLLYAFDPNIIAHGSLVTTDMALALWGTAALFLVARYLRLARRRYWIGAGVMLGLGLASKVSAISLAPVVGLLCLLWPRSLPWQRRLSATAGCLALAALVLWAAYGFEMRPLPGIPFPLPAATHVEIYRSLQEHYQLGHPSFLMGQNSDHGWWYYFPVAFALKTPWPTLILMLVASGQVGKCASGQVGKCASGQVGKWASLQVGKWRALLLFPLLYAASTFFSSVNIGYRHLLPLLPFLFIFVSCITHHALRLTLRITFYALLLCLPILALRIAPHYLAYFNVPDGYRYLVDSNLDWGQNLWQLRDWMDEHKVERVYYAHYSPARPQVYAVQADFLPPDPRAVDFAPFDPAPGVYAIGATVLQGAYTPDVNTYAWFRAREPAARLGHALFVYRVPARPAPAWAAVCAAPTPVLAPEQVRAGFGNADMRVILLDCGQSWIYPAGDEFGGYVLPPDVEPPPGATLEAAARHPDASPFYNLYRVESGVLLPGQAVDVVTLDGPLAFLGYQVEAVGARPGQVIELWTFWEVKKAPDRPLSLMAHLIGPDGSAITVGDGLGVPVDQWRLGDVIVQRHLLQVPEDAPAGEYQLQTGAYWLDTMERWQVCDREGVVYNHLVLEMVEVTR
ncbi:MAG: hypothetical protein DRJ03_12885 [Chloroflexi bacterium]|nr:MAG: hypothetical protein DRJ03_12885 [Chloroflexota bacterium]